LAQQKKAKMGRPKLPKGEAMGRVIQVRFNPEDSRKIADAAKAGKQTVSEWVRSTVHATLNG
jgi:predicted HicB family RNase H-like nuclease